MTLHAARNNLAAIWFVGFAILFLLVSVQAVFGKYGSGLDLLTGHGWLISLTFPTLGLMVGVLSIGRSETLEREIHNVRLLRYCQAASVFFLLMIAAVPLIEPAVEIRIQELFKFSLGPFGAVQAIVVGLIGKFFVLNN